MESFILSEMKEHVKQFEILSKPENRPEDPKIQEINVKIEQVTVEINKLLGKVANADGILMDYINGRIKELDAKINVYSQELSELSPLENSERYNTKQLKNYMDHWDELEFDDKREGADQLILVIHATEDICKIKWRI